MNNYQLISDLKLELSLKPDNYLYKSNRLGDISKFFFLLSRECKIELSPINESYHVFHNLSSNEIIFQAPLLLNIDPLKVREAFDVFYKHLDSQSINLISENQLSNISFLKDCSVKTFDLGALIKALEISKDLSLALDKKKNIYNKVCDEYFDVEYDLLKDSFLKDMGLSSLSHNLSVKDDDGDKILSMIQNHVNWNSKYEDLKDRKNKFQEILITQNIIDLCNKLASFPCYIACFATRKLINLERLLYHNLDEFLPLKSQLEKINNIISLLKISNHDDLE